MVMIPAAAGQGQGGTEPPILYRRVGGKVKPKGLKYFFFYSKITYFWALLNIHLDL
jgi:hypothetical protein